MSDKIFSTRPRSLRQGRAGARSRATRGVLHVLYAIAVWTGTSSTWSWRDRDNREMRTTESRVNVSEGGDV